MQDLCQSRKQLIDLIETAFSVAALGESDLAQNPNCKFSRTVKWGMISRPWGTMAKPRRALRSVDNFVTLLPLNNMSPERAGRSPVMTFSVVVFPTPFRPMRH